MRLPKLSSTQYVVIGTVATTMVVLPLTVASAAFDDGDYSLSECSLDATLKVRGNGNGISVQSDGSLFVHTSREDGELAAALVVDLGSEAIDDNTVVTVTSADGDGLTCAVENDVDDATVAALIGLDESANLADEVSADESSADEALELEDSSDEAVEKVVLCHKPDGVQPHEIEVSADALEAHLAHDDLEGQCPADLPDARQDARDERDAAKTAREAARDAARAEREAEQAERRAARGEDADED